MKLLLASGNPKKLRELEAHLAQHGVQVLSPSDVGGLPEVVEDGATFSANAAKKARCAALHSKRWSLADDSGLEVDALDGAPGVYSARFSGEGATDARNNALLLERLRDVPRERRGARFVCSLALARPDGEIVIALEGYAHGSILEQERGERDFGYDPLFLFDEPDLPQTGRSFAELSLEEKSDISHRGRALKQLEQALAQLDIEAHPDTTTHERAEGARS